jgi:pyrroline-5-carboxylate reductase
MRKLVKGKRTVDGLLVARVSPLVDKGRIKGLLSLIPGCIVVGTPLLAPVTRGLARGIYTVKTLGFCQIIKQLRRCTCRLQALQLGIGEIVDSLSALEIADDDMRGHISAKKIHDIVVVQSRTPRNFVVGGLFHATGRECGRHSGINLRRGGAGGQPDSGRDPQAEAKKALNHGKVVIEPLRAGKLFPAKVSPRLRTVKLLAHDSGGFTFARMTYAFLGAGKMAMALIQGVLRANLCSASEIIASSRSREGLESLVSATGVRSAKSNADAVAQADTILLCVKPSDALTALGEAGRTFDGRLLVSVVTGLKIATLRQAAPGCRVVRAMPNTAAMVGRSATAIAMDADATREDATAAEAVFGAVGEVFAVIEDQLDAVTGLSGSGPAFIYLVMEALSDGGVSAGLPRKLAQDLAIQTVAGAAEMAASTKEHPALLREMVASPGGTTIAGLAVLESAAVRSAFIGAVKAATARSKELSGIGNA